MPRYGYFATEPRQDKMLGVAFVSHHAKIQEANAEIVTCSGPNCKNKFLKIKYGNNFKAYCCERCGQAARQAKRKSAKNSDAKSSDVKTGAFNWRIK